MSTVSIRVATLATILALPGALYAQAPAPAATPAAPPAASTPPSGAAAARPENPPGMTPPAADQASGAQGAPNASGAQGATGDGSGQNRRKRRHGNFMPANPDATPVLPGQAPTASGGASAQGAGSRTVKADGAHRVPSGGMQRAFQSFQTKEESYAYRDKVKAVKTVSECKALLESTRKEMEPRAKAQNKTINVDIDGICNASKERGRLTG